MPCVSPTCFDGIGGSAFLLLWIIVTMATRFHGVETEVASSVSAMTSLISQEEKLITHLGKVLELAEMKGENATWISRIKSYLDCIEVKHRSIANAAGTLSHPVIGFRLVRRLAKEWNDVTGIVDSSRRQVENVNALYDNLRAMRDVISKWTRWPRTQDVKDSAMGLIRIGSTYDLYPRSTDDFTSNSATPRTQHRNDDSNDNNIGISLKMDIGGRTILRRFDYNTSITDLFSSTSNTHITDIEPCDKNCSNIGGNSVKYNDENNDNKSDNISNNIKGNNKTNSNSRMEDKDDIRDKSNKIELKTHIDSKQSCNYNYHVLDFKDFSYVINVAINQKLKTEAEHWYSLLESERYHGDKTNSNGGERKRMDKLKKKIEAIHTKGQSSDEIMKNYVKLCREASEVSSYSSLPASPTLVCSWRHTNPYLRYKVELLHISPDIHQFHDVISPHEIEHIKDMAKEKLLPSTLDIDESSREEVRYWRVSQTAWFRDETPVLQRLSERVGHLTGLDTGIVTDTKGNLDNINSEPLQVVNYGLGGLYGPHLDTLHSTSHTSDTSRRHAGDRLATWMFYLGDVHIGGATVFPRINVSVKPIKGSAILWYNLLRNGQIDKRTVHAGCPVVIGDKWVANKWVRDTDQWMTRPCLLDPLL